MQLHHAISYSISNVSVHWGKARNLQSSRLTNIYPKYTPIINDKIKQKTFCFYFSFFITKLEYRIIPCLKVSNVVWSWGSNRFRAEESLCSVSVYGILTNSDIFEKLWRWQRLCDETSSPALDVVQKMLAWGNQQFVNMDCLADIQNISCHSFQPFS